MRIKHPNLWGRFVCLLTEHVWLYFTRYDTGEISMRQGSSRQGDWRACPKCGMEQVRSGKWCKWRRVHRIWSDQSWQKEVGL